ncbi:transposable element Tcb1 transposase [Trichonephila clavipes]|nr:transposable element Tcb1 transposase [Trichonephila clavipes]
MAHQSPVQSVTLINHYATTAPRTIERLMRVKPIEDQNSPVGGVWKIGSRVGRNQTVMRICDRWMQEGTTDRRGRSHPPQCTTSPEWSVCKTSIAWSTLDAEPQTSPPPMATAVFQQDNARPHVARIVQGFFVNHQIEFLPWPARSPDLSPIENMWSMVAQRLTEITPPAAPPDQLWQRVEAAWSAIPQEHIQIHIHL